MKNSDCAEGPRVARRHIRNTTGRETNRLKMTGRNRIGRKGSAGQETGARAGRRVGDANVAAALSLPEVLTVVGIVVVLLAILLPSFRQAREEARRVVCKSRLKQWGMATWYFREDHGDRLPTEGTYLAIDNSGTWFNELPPYLGLPAYRDFDRIGNDVRARATLDVWICPSKNLTRSYVSQSGRNQFHYGLNQVLDGLGTPPAGSPDAPGFPDAGDQPLPASIFDRRPRTVWMFDIAPNSPAGSPRDVANKYQRDHLDRPMGRFHGDYANLLFLDGAVDHCRADDLVSNHDFRHGEVRWNSPRLYWGYRP